MQESLVENYLKGHKPKDPNSTMEIWEIREQGQRMAEEIVLNEIVNCYPSFSTHPIFLKSCKIKQGSIYFNLMYSLTDYFIWNPVMLS